MRAVLIANGDVRDYDNIKKYIGENDFIICADGGYRHAKMLGIIPDVVIGDMDSAKIEDIEEKKIIYPTRKDFTDGELVLEYAIENGYSELILIGFIGTRMDHTFTNISMLLNYPEIDALIVDEHNEIKILKDENEIRGEKGDIVSIIPMGECIEGVTTIGLEYPLCNEKLYFGKGRGVSNKMTSSSARVTKKSGMGIIIKSKD